MKAKLTNVVFGLALVLSACSQDPLDETTNAIRASTPSYAKDIKPLMVRYCEDCHTSDGLRAGGVELDRYVSLFWARQKNACVSIEAPLIEEFAEFLMPYSGFPPIEPAVTPCGKWQPYSMPEHADSKMTHVEQLMFVQWVATGAQP